MCPGLRGAPGLFAPWANCVYYHTFFGLCPVHGGETSRTPIKSIIPRCEKLSPSYVSLFVSLPCPTYWPILPGQVKYVPPATACPRGRLDWWNTFSGKVMVTDRVFTSFCVEERGAMTINQYYFHALSRKRQGWFYFRNLALYRFPLSCYSKQPENRERNQFLSFFVFFFNKEWLFPVSQADEDGWQHHRNTATKSDNYQATSFWWQRMLVLWLHAVITAPNQESRRFHATFHPWLTRKPCGECTELTATPC